MSFRLFVEKQSAGESASQILQGRIYWIVIHLIVLKVDEHLQPEDCKKKFS